MTREEAINKLEHLIISPVGREEIDETCYEVMKYLSEQRSRVLSLDELVADDVVWLEDCDKDTTVPGIYCDSNDTNTIFATRMKGYLFVKNDEYGIRWRCWSSRPTIEQMRATPWP